MPTLRSIDHGQRTAIISRVERDAMLVHVLNDGKVTMLRSDVNGLTALRGGLVERQAIFVRIHKHVEMALRSLARPRQGRRCADVADDEDLDDEPASMHAQCEQGTDMEGED